MDGLVGDLRSKTSVRRPPRGGLGPALWRRRWLGLFVVLPTLLVGGYMFGVAADQYESEARFVVRGPQGTQGSASGLGALLGMSSALSATQTDAFSVNDYLDSHDAVTALQSKLDLVKLFHRPEADPLYRLWPDQPTAETLLKYYRRQVGITFSADTGITRLRVLAFRPGDAEAIAETLLELGEKRVNDLNQRAINDTLRVAQAEVYTAEDRVAQAQKAMTVFRLKQQDINPEKTSTAQLNLVSQLQQQLAQARAQLIGMGTTLRADSPQYISLSNRVHALDTQVLVESAKLTGSNATMAPALADYEALALRREFASTNYNAAQTAFEGAKLQTLRQQLFVVRVVEPNMPERALYPRSFVIVGSVLAGLLVAYGIGWLIIAGVREHAA